MYVSSILSLYRGDAAALEVAGHVEMTLAEQTASDLFMAMAKANFTSAALLGGRAAQAVASDAALLVPGGAALVLAFPI